MKFEIIFPQIIFPQSLFHYQHPFHRLPETLHDGCVNIFAEASVLFTRVAFYLFVFRKTASSESILQGAKEMEVGGC